MDYNYSPQSFMTPQRSTKTPLPTERILLGDKTLNETLIVFKDFRLAIVFNIALCYKESDIGRDINCDQLQKELAKLALERMEETKDHQIDFRIQILCVPDDLLVEEEGEILYKPIMNHIKLDIWCTTRKHDMQNLISMAVATSFCISRLERETLEDDYYTEEQDRSARYHKGYIIATGNQRWGYIHLIEKITNIMPPGMMIKGVIHTQGTDSSLQWWRPGIAGTYVAEQKFRQTLLEKGRSVMTMYQMMAEAELISSENTNEVWNLHLVGAFINKYVRESISPAFSGALLFDLHMD